MASFQFAKVVSSLPVELAANTIYAVRVGVGFDLYVSDVTGAMAHKINTPGPSITVGTTAPASPALGDLWVDTN